MWSRKRLEKLRENMHLAAESLPDADAAETPELFAAWAVGVSYEAGRRLRYGEKLYRVKQAHTSQADWTPDITASLYEEVAKPGDGTKERPIAYNGNMALEEGLYYIQDGIEYICIWSTGIPVYEPLANLVGLYVQVVID